MLNQFRIICGLSFASCLLLACNPESMYYYTLVNHSTDTLRFYFSDSSEIRFGDYQKLLPGDTVTIYELMDLGHSKNYSCDPMIPDSTVTIELEPVGTLLKSFTDPNNWKCETDKKNTFWRLTYEIHDFDIQY